MLIIPACLAFGTLIGLLLFFLLQYISNLQFEKLLRSRLNVTYEFSQRGMKGNILFIANKLGNEIAKIKSPHLTTLSNKLTYFSTILGEPYSRIDITTFFGLFALAGAAGVFVAIVLLDIYNPIFLLLIGIGGGVLPYLFLMEKVKEKHKRIFRQLPDTLDLLALMMEAGMEFGGALNKLTELERSELTSELFLAQQEMKLGKSRADALTAMAERLKHPQLSASVNSIITSLNIGSSLVPTLKTLSEQFKAERIHLAEKAANEAPLKMMFPLILFIFPTVFIILFGPIILTFLGGRF